ncbi:MAG: RNA-directed DNA polymerase [Flavobacteriales bacterium]|nr:RNA-directed DNA polymerase [Flavobacteriales bacterium]
MTKDPTTSRSNLSEVVIGGITYNLEISLKRLKQDLRDDWFPDFLDFKDLFDNKDFFLNQLKKYTGTNDLYEPGNSLHFDIPKPGFTVRYSSETNIVDRLMYQACVDKLGPELDSIHSESIYSHRIDTDRGEKYFFRYPVEEWNKFLTDAKIELDKNENEVLLITDLSNYYESISIKDLITTLDFQIDSLIKNKDKNKELKKVSSQIKKLLDRWCEPNTKRGIPQNRDASSFLSNIFLNPVDDSMLKSGYKYFRYMDDIRVVCKNKFEARKALKLLVSELRKKGLNVNSKKTEILDLNNGSQRLLINEALQKNDKQIEQIENLLKSRQARGVQIAIPMLRKKTISLIENGVTLERHFRFCVNRLERLVRIPEIRNKIDIDDITDAVINQLIDQPWSTDSFARYLISTPLSDYHLQRIASLLLDDEKNIYEWQEYHIWRILINHNCKEASLILKARHNLEHRATNHPIIAGSTLYLCSLGDGNDRKHVADNFQNLTNFFVQRTALIGIKELDYTTIIKGSVEKFMDDCHKGSYRVLNKDFTGVYSIPPSKLNFKDFYDELPEFIS